MSEPSLRPLKYLRSDIDAFDARPLCRNRCELTYSNAMSISAMSDMSSG